MSITRVVDGGETPLFKQYFETWTDPRQSKPDESTSGGSNVAGRMLLMLFLGHLVFFLIICLPLVQPDQDYSGAEGIDTGDLHNKKVEKAEEWMPDDGSGKVQVWKVENLDLVEIPEKAHGVFFGGDCYIIGYTYGPEDKPSYILYFWQVSLPEEILSSYYPPHELLIAGLQGNHWRQDSLCWSCGLPRQQTWRACCPGLVFWGLYIMSLGRKTLLRNGTCGFLFHRCESSWTRNPSILWRSSREKSSSSWWEALWHPLSALLFCIIGNIIFDVHFHSRMATSPHIKDCITGRTTTPVMPTSSRLGQHQKMKQELCRWVFYALTC